MKKVNKKGFTIVELVIVIAVIAILAAVLIPTFSAVISKAKVSARLQTAQNALKMVLAAEDDAYIPNESYVVVKDGTDYYKFTYADGKLGTGETYSGGDNPAGFYKYSKNAAAEATTGESATIENKQLTELVDSVVFVKIPTT